jgi:hypothetical protein
VAGGESCVQQNILLHGPGMHVNIARMRMRFARERSACVRKMNSEQPENMTETIVQKKGFQGERTAAIS